MTHHIWPQENSEEAPRATAKEQKRHPATPQEGKRKHYALSFMNHFHVISVFQIFGWPVCPIAHEWDNQSWTCILDMQPSPRDGWYFPVSRLWHVPTSNCEKPWNVCNLLRNAQKSLLPGKRPGLCNCSLWVHQDVSQNYILRLCVYCVYGMVQ